MRDIYLQTVIPPSDDLLWLKDMDLVIDQPKKMETTEIYCYSVQDILSDFGGTYKSLTLILGCVVTPILIRQYFNAFAARCGGNS